MHQTARSTRGMVTAPHHLAAQSGLAVLREGGNAIEAMVAAAATIAVVYPHMNALGGDAFWLINLPEQGAPIAISACGPAGAKATPAFYRAAGCEAIPFRGPLGANTVAATVDGWREALTLAGEIGGVMPLGRLLEDAIYQAEAGTPVAQSFRDLVRLKWAELIDLPGFADTFLPDGRVQERGEVLKQPRLGASLRLLADEGLDSFYRGKLARQISADLERVGSPVTANDLETFRAHRVAPLMMESNVGRLFNHPPPTQGLSSLMILGLFEQLGVEEAESFAHIHGLVEATKAAFDVRDRIVTDPSRMHADLAALLSTADLVERAKTIDPAKASPWPRPAEPGDTIWMGAVDSQGLAVSFIQSIYWDFGSGVVLEDSGILWQNRGASFQLDDKALRGLAPGRLPFHTLNPAMAQLNDGRVMTYGCMGGEGQPQTQSALFTRIAQFNQEPQEAVTAPRWLLGKTWGEESNNLKLEGRFSDDLIAAMRNAGHDVAVVQDYDGDVVGHAGAIVLHPDGRLEGATDPRSDGVVAAF